MASSTCIQEELITKKLFRVRPKAAPEGLRKRAVLFVHGFLGDAKETWKAPEAVESFPSLLATDEEVKDYDVFVFEYETKDLFPPAIENIADQLKFAVKQHLPHDRVILLAHSMGGLVCMSYILKLLTGAEKKAQGTGGLLLYGTPMTGVEWAKYAQLVLRLGEFKIPLLGWLNRLVKANKQVEALTAGSEFIDRLNGEWVLRVLNGGHPDVPAGQRAWFPVRVVSGNDDWVVKESSARGFYSKIDWINVDKDHHALVKPIDRLEMSYQVARDFLKESRRWMNPQSLVKLRRQLDGISDVHRGKSIANWQFELNFEPDQCKAIASGFGLSGFRPFRVKQCSYRFTISQNQVKFGFAIGPIAAEAIWSDDFAFLHSVRFGALSVEQTDPIRKRLREIVAQGAAGWGRLFDSVLISVRRADDDQWFQLSEGPVEQVDDGLVRRFLLPKEAISCVDQEVEIKISFRSVLPAEITDYTVMFPWLCDGFTVRLGIEGNPSYLVDSQAMRGVPSLQIKREQHEKIEYSSQDLILPGSYIRFEWGFENRAPR